MTIQTEGAHAGEFLLSEARGYRSRENIVISAGAGRLLAGTLIAILTTANAGQATAAETNAGNGTLSAIAVTSQAITGDYLVSVTAAGAGGAKFTVTDPTGREVGKGTAGTQFVSGGLTFDLAEGATPFAKGDAFTIAVQAGLGEWVPYDDTGADDGRRAAAGVLWAGVDAVETDVQAVAIVRDAEVIDSLLTGLDEAGQAELLAAGLIVRTSNPGYPTLGE